MTASLLMIHYQAQHSNALLPKLIVVFMAYYEVYIVY